MTLSPDALEKIENAIYALARPYASSSQASEIAEESINMIKEIISTNGTVT